jgi:asparagine synthase (glutamine-hydrolysing)
MAHSLEVRVPFLDHELVEFCARIPARHKVHHLTTKHILKHAARGLVPDHIVDKRKIGFFRGSSHGWLQAQLAGAVSDYLLAPSPAYAEFLDRDAVEQLIRELRSDSRQVQLVLAILLLEVWLRTYLPRATAASPAASKPIPALP